MEYEELKELLRSGKLTKEELEKIKRREIDNCQQKLNQWWEEIKKELKSSKVKFKEKEGKILYKGQIYNNKGVFAMMFTDYMKNKNKGIFAMIMMFIPRMKRSLRAEAERAENYGQLAQEYESLSTLLRKEQTPVLEEISNALKKLDNPVQAPPISSKQVKESHKRDSDPQETTTESQEPPISTKQALPPISTRKVSPMPAPKTHQQVFTGFGKPNISSKRASDPRETTTEKRKELQELPKISSKPTQQQQKEELRNKLMNLGKGSNKRDSRQIPKKRKTDGSEAKSFKPGKSSFRRSH
ncbi:hypothetical protein [Abyssalbus ytuae]|uniref:Uncharacterized protein n=1 Tax=Abyssalbus ytuae TaxID=2926907 RepID=A0A9E7D2R7_9FLAO|nr:hypothetical protein [Abyssalbus ytuae]UOB16989.1 hypothetical protein MQE35_14770 [Abyssalbus ytuae]